MQKLLLKLNLTKRYSKNTWKTVYEPKFIVKNGIKKPVGPAASLVPVANEANLGDNSEKKEEELSKQDVNMEADASNTEIKTNDTTNPILPAAKLPPYFHKPRSKYKRQIYLNAVTFCVNDYFLYLLVLVT